MAIIGLSGIDTTAFMSPPDREGVDAIHSAFPAPTRRVPVPRAGNVQNFQVYVDTNTLDGTLIVEVLVNGSSVLSLTYAGLETGSKSTGGPASILAGQGVSIRHRPGTATTGAFTGIASVEFVPTG